MFACIEAITALRVVDMKQQTASRKDAMLAKIRKYTDDFSKKPTHKKAILLIVFATAIVLLIILIAKLLAPKPKTFEDYMATIEQVQEADRRASENSAVFRSLEEQLGTEAYEKHVLGIDDRMYETATQHQVEAIVKVEVNNAETEMLGGIARPEQLEQFKSPNPPNLAAQKAVDSRIAMAQGKQVNETLADALYVPRDAVPR